MSCSHQQYALVSPFRTTYSEQTCRKCVLSHYNNKNDNPRTNKVSPTLSGEVRLVRLHTRHGIFHDANDIRPSEVPEFIGSITFNDHVQKQHGPTWTKEEIPIDEALISDDAKPFETASLTEQKMKDLEFGKKLLRDKEKLKKLSNEQFYKTSTQKLYEGADWSVFLKPKVAPPLHMLDVHKSFPGPRAQSRQTRVEKPTSLPGQVSWDYLQTRDNEGKENKPFSFTSSSLNSKQIPNYTGMTYGFGEKDMSNREFTSLATVRTSKPRFVETSRKPGMPGYGGFLPSGRSKEVFTEESQPRCESTASIYKPHNLPPPISFNRHRSPLSKTVTLVHPFNCYNNVNYPLFRTVSQNRI